MHLTLHLTTRCNLRCRYCYAPPSPSEDMSLATLRAAIDLAEVETARQHPRESVGIVLFGGEPLLRRDLVVEAVRHCRARTGATGQRFHFKMTTNGLLLDDAFFTAPDTKSVFVALSHDGAREAHDRHRVDAAGRGSFDRLEEKVALLLSHRRYSPVLTVVTPETVAHYARSIEQLFARGFRYLLATLDYGVDWPASAVRRLALEYRKLADWYYAATRAGHKFFFGPFEVKIASHIDAAGSCRERCELGLRQLSVAPNGRLYPCVQFVGDGSDARYAIGDVRAGIDRRARDELARVARRDEESCGRCAIRHRCNHTCGCISLRATGSLERVSPLLCAHERMVVPVADALASRLFRRRDALFLHKHYDELYPLVSVVEDATSSP
jgi:uncharacterized protein